MKRVRIVTGGEAIGPDRPHVFLMCAVSPDRRSWRAPGRIRTCDLRIRSPALYPAELRARSLFLNSLSQFAVVS